MESESRIAMIIGHGDREHTGRAGRTNAFAVVEPDRVAAALTAVDAVSRRHCSRSMIAATQEKDCRLRRRSDWSVAFSGSLWLAGLRGRRDA